MTLNVLICHADGTQEIVVREVPDDYFQADGDDGTAAVETAAQ
jgi:hypothetical protein